MKAFFKGIIFLFLISVALILFLIFILSDNPAEAVFFFFLGPFRNIFSFGNMLNSAVPLVFGALGVILAIKTASLNLGGEGQVYIGAFITTITAVVLNNFGAFAAFIAAAAGGLSAGSLGAISGFLKARWKTNELISSFLISCAVIPVINYLVTGPFLDPDTSLLSTRKIAENMRLPLILMPSGLSAGLYLAVAFTIIICFFLNKTKLGYEFRMAGKNEMFARYGGINTKLNTVLAMAMSGFMYGLAGSIAVLGTHYAVIKEFSAGLGWSGLTTALIASFSPLAVIPCAVFLAWINSGARIAMQNTGLTFEIAYIIQAVLFLLSSSLIIKNIFDKKRKG